MNRLHLLLFVLAWIGASGQALAATNATITPQRTRGVAPLFIFVDASTATSTSTDLFDLRYDWDFGDPSSGAWPTDGRSKNTATGPWAAHVYDSPGTYQITLAATEPSGARVEAIPVLITVDDPETIFQKSTVCISRTTDTTGCPAVGTPVTNQTGSFDTILSTQIAAGKRRILFKRGQAWNASAQHRIAVSGPGHIGAFGAGAKPAIDDLNMTGIFTFGSPSPDWRVSDLHLTGHNSGDATRPPAFWSYSKMKQILLYRIDVPNGGFWVPVIWAPENFPAPNPTADNHEQMALVESNLARIDNGYQFYGSARFAALLGNTLNYSAATHVMRLECADRVVISDNWIGNAKSSNLKFDGGEGFCNGNSTSRRTIISDNTFVIGTLTGSSELAIAPRDQFVTNERITEIIVERNFFNINDQEHSTIASQILNCDMDTSVVRNNIFRFPGGSSWYRAMLFWDRNGNWPPNNNEIYNNSCYTDASSPTDPHCVVVQAGDSNVIKNNVLYGTGSTNAFLCGGTHCTASNNVATSKSPFLVSSPKTAEDFQPAPGSGLIDAGAALPVIDDFGGRRRSGPIDIGAWEFGATAAGAPPAAPILLE